MVRELAERIASVGVQVEPAIAEQMGSDMKALSDELARPEPRRAWYELTLGGIKEAAEAMGEVGKPIIDIVLKLMPLLLPSRES